MREYVWKKEALAVLYTILMLGTVTVVVMLETAIYLWMVTAIAVWWTGHASALVGAFSLDCRRRQRALASWHLPHNSASARVQTTPL
jgi:hypothetical protein